MSVGEKEWQPRQQQKGIIQLRSRQQPGRLLTSNIICLLRFHLLVVITIVLLWSIPQGIRLSRDLTAVANHDGRNLMFRFRGVEIQGQTTIPPPAAAAAAIVNDRITYDDAQQQHEHQDEEELHLDELALTLFESILSRRGGDGGGQNKQPGSYRDGNFNKRNYFNNAAARTTTNSTKSQSLMQVKKRNRTRFPNVIYFLHIHKSAGSLVCNLAALNNMSVNSIRNCNVQSNQYCCGQRDTIQEQIAFAKRTDFDLVASEREMYESMAPDYYDYDVSLRDSKSRYYSQWKHLRRHGMVAVHNETRKLVYGYSSWIFGNNTTGRKKKRTIPMGVDPLATFPEGYEGQPDNWNTRILCCRKCRPCTKFQISRKLFDYALQRLYKFARILFVEDMETSYNQFAKHYNLSTYKELESNITRSQRKQMDDDGKQQQHDTVVKSSKQEEESWDPLMSALDDALYEFAKRKFYNSSATFEQLRTMTTAPFGNQKILDRYFAEGPELGCRDACCGKCTPY